MLYTSHFMYQVYFLKNKFKKIKEYTNGIV